jgi:hypothetical protein
LSEQLQLRRGTGSQVASFTGAAGEVVFDTTNNRIVANDGTTVGGNPAAKLAEVITNTRTPISDAAYTVLITDRTVAYATLTAARVVTLPASSAYPTGTQLLIVDESGNCGVTKTLTVNAAGSDHIDGATSAIVNQAYGYIELESNAAGAWTITGQGFMPALANLAAAPKGGSIQFGVIEVLLSGLTGASVTASAAVPTNCIVYAVGAFVVTTITGATSYSVGWNGPGGSSSTFGSGLSLLAGSNNAGLIGPVANYTPAANLTVTAAGPNFTGGAVRLSIHYMLCNPSAA